MNLRTRGERLQWVREQLGLSREEAAERVGLALSTYASKERAQQGASSSRDFTYEEGELYMRRLGQPNYGGWLYTGKGDQPKLGAGGKRGAESEQETAQNAVPGPSVVPVVGYFGAPTGEGALYGFESEELPYPCFATSKTVAIEVKGRSVAEGMFAFYDDERKPLGRSHFGTCVLKLANHRLLLRRVDRDQKGTPVVVPFNHDEPPIDRTKVKWAAKVIAIAPRW